MEQLVDVQIALKPAQALALAQFVKRVGWSEIRQNAVDDAEADLMVEAINKLTAKIGRASCRERV